MPYDVVIVGAGPAGLAAALNLGRARKRVLLCNAGPPRNAMAEHIHGFVTRDGTPPEEFRRIGRAQLAPYDSVKVLDARVEAIDGERGRFRMALSTGTVEARRVLLCTGMVDEVPSLPGYRELWGKSILQCPYCHGWEVRDGAWGVLATGAPLLDFAVLLTAWTRDVTAFTSGAFEVPLESRERLERAGVRLEERPVRALVGTGGKLSAVELDNGTRIPREILFARPPQRQTPVVLQSGVALDEQGFVLADDHKHTSRPGVYAAGDLTTPLQGALIAAAAGAMAAYMLNHELTLSLADGRG